MDAKFVFNQLFWFYLSYFLIVIAYYFIFGIIGLIEAGRRMHEDQIEDYESLNHSHFTLPVSILVPAHNEESCIRNTMLSILGLNYRNYEVIVIDDDSTDKTFDVLQGMLDLEAEDIPYRDHFKSGTIKGLYRSKRYEHIRVIRKFSRGHKAGALNAGLNLAKHRYVCVIDSDTLLEPNALLQVMTHAEKAPERVIGVSSFFGISNGFTVQDGKVIKRRWRANLLGDFQQLEYIRSFIGTRIGWSRLNSLPILSGAFAVWEKRFLLHIGGFSGQYSSEDMEITFHAQKDSRRGGKAKYEILFLPYVAGWTLGPETIKSLMTQRNRWQRVATEAMAHYAPMFLNPRYGTFGMVTLPYFLFYEVLGAVIEISSVIVTTLGFLTGLMNVGQYASFLLFLVLFQSLTTMIPLWVFNYRQKLFDTGGLLYMIMLSFFEMLTYRWITTAARVQGLYDFCCGNHAFTRMERPAQNSRGNSDHTSPLKDEETEAAVR